MPPLNDQRGKWVRPSLAERLQAKLVPQGDCLVFTGGGDRYGLIRVRYRQMEAAHRVAWVLSGRVLAKHKVLHHRCENTKCCNPDHLEVTTRKDHKVKFHLHTRCRKGHAMKGSNVVIHRRGKNGTKRLCRTCLKARGR